MTLSEAQHLSRVTLQHHFIGSYVTETQLILESLGFSSLDIIMKSETMLSEEQAKKLNHILERRIKREPLQHILGYAYFYGLRLKVTSDVLIPRPETEHLVEIALGQIKNINNPNVIDIGTGSGAIALAIKHQRLDVNVMATDISQKALELAGFNAKQHQLEIHFVHSDLLSNPVVKNVAKHAHLIVANLPYLPDSDKQNIDPEVLYDPDISLYSGEDGLNLFRKFIEACPKTLAILLELDPRNVHAACNYASQWKPTIHQDLTGRDRFLHLIPVNKLL